MLFYHSAAQRGESGKNFLLQTNVAVAYQYILLFSRFGSTKEPQEIKEALELLDFSLHASHPSKLLSHFSLWNSLPIALVSLLVLSPEN